MTMSEPVAKDRNLSLELVRVTEAAALAAAGHMGSGDEKAADLAAISAAHRLFASLNIDGTICVGEGRKSECDQFFIGEKIGNSHGPQVDVAIVAFLKVPEIYMDKIAVGPGVPDGVIDLEREPVENLKALAECRGVPVSDLVVCMLDRPRHSVLLEKVRDAGARVRLILGGDVSGVIGSALPEGGIDMYLGIGGAPQGVLGAAGLRGFGGRMQARLIARRDEDRTIANEMGIEDFDRIYSETDMAGGNVTFAATGVTYGAMLKGVDKTVAGATSQSVVVRSVTGTYRYIETHHDFTRRQPVG